ncbi:hypothetical protein BGX34_002537 [Mortierella sp. NVP85]|nr:hypothetical protein BGX34_002537 [Mortierella sp. NVP85]
MSLEQLGKRAGRMLANKVLEYLDEKTKHPAQPAKQSFPSDHKANLASQYPGNTVPDPLQQQQ